MVSVVFSHPLRYACIVPVCFPLVICNACRRVLPDKHANSRSARVLMRGTQRPASASRIPTAGERQPYVGSMRPRFLLLTGRNQQLCAVTRKLHYASLWSCRTTNGSSGRRT